MFDLMSSSTLWKSENIVQMLVSLVFNDSYNYILIVYIFVVHCSKGQKCCKAHSIFIFKPYVYMQALFHYEQTHEGTSREILLGGKRSFRYGELGVEYLSWSDKILSQTWFNYCSILILLCKLGILVVLRFGIGALILLYITTI